MTLPPYWPDEDHERLVATGVKMYRAGWQSVSIILAPDGGGRDLTFVEIHREGSMESSILQLDRATRQALIEALLDEHERTCS